MASKAAPNDYVVPGYEDDFAAWAFHQAMLVRSGQFHLLDRWWIAEELDSLGRGEFDKLESALRAVLMHMLKWDHQPTHRSRGWTNSIKAQRKRVAKQLDDNPSLAPRRERAIADAYDDARLEASSETNLPVKAFPPDCPYSWDEIMKREFDWPEDVA